MSTTMHQLKIFPVPFASEPADIVDIPEGVILGEWLTENVRNFDPDANGVEASIPYDSTVLGDVYLYAAPPEGSAISSILSPILKVLGLAPAKPKAPQQQVRGSELELATFQGNQVKYGQAVREIFGKVKVYPDYLVPRRSYFTGMRDHWAEMLLCVGVGEHQIAGSSITFGSTPVIALGGGAYARVYQPGESLAGESTAEWWHTSAEVGQTSTGNAGLPLRTIYAATQNAPRGRYLVSGNTIAPTGGQLFPSSWSSGMYLDIRYLRTYSAAGSTLTGDFSGLQVSAGDTVELDGDYQGEFEVASYTPPQGMTDGTASLWSATTPPSLDYSATPAQFSVSVGLFSGVLSISGSYSNESELVSALNAAAASTSLSGLVQFESGLAIRELPPYAGWRITVSDISGSGSMFGNIAGANSATFVGTAASGGSGARLELVDFISNYSAAELSILKTGQRFIITGASPIIITVDRVDSSGESDWTGWGAGFETLDIDIGLGADSSQGGWVGTFKATPAEDLCDALEFDVLFPQGLTSISTRGVPYAISVGIQFRYRSSSSDPWEYFTKTYSRAQKDQIGFTERIEFNQPRRIVECDMRRTNPESQSVKHSDKAEWFGLRTRIVGAPTSYPDFTTVAVRVRGSSAIGTDADEMLSVIATRKLDGVPELRISKAVEHIARRASVDTAELSRLENDAWTPRGDTFDFSFEKPATIKQAVNTALSVGFADFTLEDGIMKPVREALIDPSLIHVYRQTFSARNTLKGSLRSTYELFSDDETDCIDVKYIDSRTWRVEIVRCKEGDPNEPPRKVEEMEADGISDRDKAFQWGMRKLMEIKTESTRHRCKTELDALNCGYGSYVNFVREIPGWSQSSRVKSVAGLVLTTVDQLDWQEEGDHVVALRRPDGTMSEIQNAERVDGNSILVPQLWSFDPTPIETNVFFGIRQRFATPAIVRQVKPAGMNVDVAAIGYNPEKYQYDDAEANN